MPEFSVFFAETLPVPCAMVPCSLFRESNKKPLSFQGVNPRPPPSDTPFYSIFPVLFPVSRESGPPETGFAGLRPPPSNHCLIKHFKMLGMQDISGPQISWAQGRAEAGRRGGRALPSPRASRISSTHIDSVLRDSVIELAAEVESEF
jgi:hypothetical protein